MVGEVETHGTVIVPVVRLSAQNCEALRGGYLDTGSARKKIAACDCLFLKAMAAT